MALFVLLCMMQQKTWVLMHKIHTQLQPELPKLWFSLEREKHRS